MRQAVGKPMSLSGITPAGAAFTTADWKGKVVLVDFWATWCVPCKQELPRVKAMYDQYHDKGLEIVGISSDTDVTELNKCVAAVGMPWPQLFDPRAAMAEAFHPLNIAFGANSIPTMFLIDKSGLCRSGTARTAMEDLVPKLLAK